MEAHLRSMDSNLFPASLNPPAHRGVDLASGPRPSWILLDFAAYFANKVNYTTAVCNLQGKMIQVTFVPAHPPRVSYFCVYCPDLKPTDYAIEPKIIATEANLVLLRIVIGSRYEAWCRGAHEYLIYRAGGPNEFASLEHLPHSRPYYFHDDQVGLLSNGTGGYTVAALLDDASVRYNLPPSPCKYRVCIFDSKDKVWTVKAVPVLLPKNQQQGFYHATSKVITIGGKCGTMAFVDLWRGILQYDVLGENPSLRYTQLPEAFPGSREYNVSPLHTRDIAFVNNRIKFVEMAMNVNMSRGCDWMATTWSMPATNSQHATTSSQDGWCSEVNIGVATIRYDENLLGRIKLPQMMKCREGKPQPLEKLRTGHPTLSLHDDDIVYFMTKVKPRDRKACVIAVNMKQGTIQEVATFGAQRTLGINFTYMHSRISNYLNITPVLKESFGRLGKGKKFSFGLHSTSRK
ncbi:unnamed protein product [Urochloa humidicola]